MLAPSTKAGLTARAVVARGAAFAASRAGVTVAQTDAVPMRRSVRRPLEDL
jgi:hypothetical protein